MAQIDRLPFGSTGHLSSRVIFGAAALYSMRQDRADHLLETLLEYGINHIDTAAAYGDSELRVAPWMKTHRRDFFLATKTGERTKKGAYESIRRSLERMQVDQVDLIQLHNLVDPHEWEVALGAGGALEALVDARAEGLVRFVGVTGHGFTVARRHILSLQRFAFDSVLVPYNATMMRQAAYASDFEELAALCRDRGVALQTIKSVARRRWQDGAAAHFSWYEPLTDADAIGRGVRFALSRPGFFLNSSSDGRLLRPILEAAAAPAPAPSLAEIDADIARYGMQPLFEAGLDDI
ncbi:MAG TPA: aldo/keto reductase [Candidatus Binatia bacterium]|jgi:aryl-alcohol dehydrogenase-like predicted oxidoreductase